MQERNYNQQKILSFTIGRTASGKTFFARPLCELLGASYISEGSIKRMIKKDYCALDSLDETLRNKAYKKAIKFAKRVLEKGNNVLIDASFHRSFRRNWLYNELLPFCKICIILYFICPSDYETEKRINRRNSMRSEKGKEADIHANIFDIYRFINKTFDEFNLEVVNSSTPLLYYKFNTLSKCVIHSEMNEFNNTSANLPIKEIMNSIENLWEYTAMAK